MSHFPALHDPETGRYHLFCGRDCRDRFPYTLDRAHNEAMMPRDDEHRICSQCGAPLKVTDVTARIRIPKRLEMEATVVNPGDGWGQYFMIWVADCFDPPLFLVDSSGDSDAIDEFVSSERTAHMVGIGEADRGDYAYHCHAGDIINGVEIEHEECWIDLNGKVYLENPNLSEPDTGPSGELYDGDNMGLQQINSRYIRYYGVYQDVPLPEKGIRPGNFSAWVAHCVAD